MKKAFFFLISLSCCLTATSCMGSKTLKQDCNIPECGCAEKCECSSGCVCKCNE